MGAVSMDSSTDVAVDGELKTDDEYSKSNSVDASSALVLIKAVVMCYHTLIANSEC